jgi:hypothetical protein
MDRLLSTADVVKIAEQPMAMLLYDDLAEFQRAQDLFDPATGNACLILVRCGPNNGHWVVLTKDGTDVTFFDSYGGFIDDQLDYTPVKYAPHLSRLLSKYPGRVHYNAKQVQKYSKDVNTCGRWCGLFVRNRKIGVDDFVDVMTPDGVDPDQLVVALTDENLS